MPGNARRRPRYAPYPYVQMQFILDKLRVVICVMIGVPLLLCGVSYWGIVIEGMSAGGEYYPLYAPRLFAGLIVLAVGAVFSCLTAWYTDEYSFVRSLLPVYILCVAGMFITFLVLPIDLAGIVGASFFAIIVRFVLHSLLSVAGAILPALLAAAVGWLLRAGYFLFRPGV